MNNTSFLNTYKNVEVLNASQHEITNDKVYTNDIPPKLQNFKTPMHGPKIQKCIQERIEQYGDEILECLYDLKEGLTNDELSEDHVINLQNILRENQSSFDVSVLKNMIDEIIIQSDVITNKK